MRYFVSLTGTIKSALTGLIPPEKLMAEDSYFAFSCQRTHVINPDWNLVPMEATWANVERLGPRDPNSRLDKRSYRNPPLYGGFPGVTENLMVSHHAVDEANRPLLRIFMAAVHQADAAGRIEWGVRHQTNYLRQLAKLQEDPECFWLDRFFPKVSELTRQLGVEPC